MRGQNRLHARMKIQNDIIKFVFYAKNVRHSLHNIFIKFCTNADVIKKYCKTKATMHKLGFNETHVQ